MRNIQDELRPRNPLWDAVRDVPFVEGSRIIVDVVHNLQQRLTALEPKTPPEGSKVSAIEHKEALQGWAEAGMKLSAAEQWVQYLERLIREHNYAHPHGSPGHIFVDKLDPFKRT